MAGERILVVEDESIVALDLKTRLEGLGYVVAGVVPAGAAALAQAQDCKPDMILMDIMLEGELDGIQTAVIIRQQLQIPVIYLTAYADQKTIERAKLAEPLGFIRKPLELRELHSVLEMALYKSRMDRKLRDSETRYKRLLESVTDYIYTVKVENGRAVATTHNPTCAAVTGYSLEEYQSDPDLWFKMVPVEDQPLVLEQARCLLAGGAVQALEHRLFHKSGALIWVRNTPVPHFDENGRLIAYDGLVSDITQRKRSEEQLRAANQELSAANRGKEALLKEIHHRVKNNLQVIASLLNLQLGHVQDAAACGVIRECQNRIRAIAIAHEKLYQFRDLARIEMGEYLRNLVGHLFRTFLVKPEAIRVQLAADKVALDIEQAIPCCLIINELLTNALKYAFPDGRVGEISVSLKAEAPDRAGGIPYALAIGDTGVGFPEGVDFRATASLGMQLVMTFVEQLGGEITLAAGPGTVWTIRFTAGAKPENALLAGAAGPDGNRAG